LQKAEETWNDENEKEMLETLDRQKCRRVFAKLAVNHTWQVPTLVENRRYSDADISHVIGDPRLRYIPAEERGTWKPYLVRQTKLTNRAKYLREREWEARLNLVGEMRKAGVQFLAGTDVGNSYIFPGFSLHDELTLLVKAGMTPMEALQSATRNPAMFLGMLKELGTIQNGKLADLVLLDANPLENIRNTQKIRAVIVNGRFLDRGKLDKLLAQADADAKEN
jgi:imidazolonepropionase-like amidohydrolase